MDLSDGSESITYETPEAYIDSLNQDETWVTYDADTNTVSVPVLRHLPGRSRMPRRAWAAFDVFRGVRRKTMCLAMAMQMRAFDAALTELLVEHQTDYEAYAGF